VHHILVYGDSLSWGIIPNTRRRLSFAERWPGVMERALVDAGHQVRVIEDCLNGRRTAWDDPFKPGRNALDGLEQRMEINSPLALAIVMLGANDFQSVHQKAGQRAKGKGQKRGKTARSRHRCKH
jgi:lysophospholipase L1-like esterase